jgi:cysteinyl-tRNA synthetase
MDPATLSAAAIATLVITKAFEKTGEVLGEKALEQGGKLVRLLKERFPKADSALARVEEKPEDWGEAVLEVEAAAKDDPEVAEAVQEVATAAKENANAEIVQKLQAIEDAIKAQQPTTRQEFGKVAEVVEKAVFGNTFRDFSGGVHF